MTEYHPVNNHTETQTNTINDFAELKQQFTSEDNSETYFDDECYDTDLDSSEINTETQDDLNFENKKDIEPVEVPPKDSTTAGGEPEVNLPVAEIYLRECGHCGSSSVNNQLMFGLPCITCESCSATVLDVSFERAAKKWNSRHADKLIEEKEEEYERCRNANEILSKEITELKSKNQTLEEEKLHLSATMDELNSKSTLLNQLNSQYGQIITSMQRDITAKEQRIKELQMTIKDYENCTGKMDKENRRTLQAIKNEKLVLETKVSTYIEILNHIK